LVSTFRQNLFIFISSQKERLLLNQKRIVFKAYLTGNAALLFLEHRYGSNQGSVENKDGRPQRTFKIIVTSLKIVFVVMFIIMEFALWITYNKLSDNTVDDLIYLY